MLASLETSSFYVEMKRKHAINVQFIGIELITIQLITIQLQLVFALLPKGIPMPFITFCSTESVFFSSNQTKAYYLTK